ncbi:uncharacterized protein LOC127734539 [Mytilus californianus]|uniref:uncharacterized protein LOC127734539 n=1 Tax=Mytilus californianus TaxID=6549 RepID=UPI002245B4C5|nr:uncharacterized protein LOC127734539 [Mytilus californianus]
MDSIMDAVQEMNRQQTTVWQRLNSKTLVENSKQTIRRLENLEEHVQNLETQCNNNSTKLTDINLLVHSLLEMVNKFAVAVENLQDNKTSEKISDLLNTANKSDNPNINHASTTSLQSIRIPPTTRIELNSEDKDENSKNVKIDQHIHNMDSTHTINSDKYKTMCPYKTDLSLDVYNVSFCRDFPKNSHKDDSDFITDAEEPLCRTDNNDKFACNEEENLIHKNISIQAIDNRQLLTSNMNIQKPNKRCTKNKFGYKCTRLDLQSDNRLSFHNSLESFEGNVFSSPVFRVPVELSPVPNIKQNETTHIAMSLNSGLNEKDDEDNSQFITDRQEDQYCLRNRSDDNVRLSEPNIPQRNDRCTNNDFGFKTTRSETQYDNRVRFYSSSACFEGCEISSSKIEVPIENIPVPNIEQQPFIHDKSPKVTSSETWESQPQTQTDLHEDSGVECNAGFGEMKQLRTIRDWLGHLQQILAFNGYKQNSSFIKRGGGRHITLVLDISERMKGRKFEAMKTAAVQYIEGIRQVAMLGMADNIGLAVFGGQSRLIQETTNDYSLILEHIGQLHPMGNAPIIGGLLMGLAGVLSGPVGRIGDNSLQGHMIIFTDETSGHVLPEYDTEIGIRCSFEFGNFRGLPETGSIQQMITSTHTKVYYVPVGDGKTNPILEETVRQTHGKVIQTSEMHRLIRMTQVIGLASRIASEIRYCPQEQTREVIKRKIRMASSHDDSHDDCSDMVMDFLNPLNMENGQGKFVELSSTTLQLGDRVRRGPDWSFGDQDRNLPGTVVGQDENCIIWVEWDHGQTNVYAYDEQRHIYKIIKVNEPRILVDEMIAVGCRVVRGQDWRFGDTDGGPGSIGTVLDVRRDGKVVVRWDCKRTGLYKMRHKGRFEIRLKDDKTKTSRQTKTRTYRRRSMSDEEDEYVSDATTTTSTKHASDYVIPIYSDSTVSAIWEYKDGSDWKEYPDDINVKIERAYQRKQRKTIIEMDRTTFEVHFSEMEQENPRNKTKVTVRRRD